MKSKARIVVVGVGLIGRKHLEVVTEHASLAAIVDPDPKAKAVSDTLGAPWYDDLEACLLAEKPDGAIIATPNHLHFPQGEACLRQGVPVLIEKPLTASAEEGKALVALESTLKTPILVGHHRRHSSVAKAAKAAIDTGRLGRVVTVNALFWLNKPADYFKAEWRTKEGGGPTYINLIHDIDMLQHLCGPIIRVQAREANAVRGFDVEDTSAVILEFASGALGTVSICDTTSAPWSWELTSGENPAYPRTDQSCYTLGGTKAALSIPDLRLWRHEGQQSWWSPIKDEKLTIEEQDPIKAQFLHFLEVVAGRSQPMVSAREGLGNIQVLEAIKSAARSGKLAEVG